MSGYTIKTLIEDLRLMICESGSEDISVVIRHVSEHEFGPEDNLENFYVFYDEKTNQVVIRVQN